MKHRVCPQGPTVSGIDVSHYQSSIDFTKLQRVEMQFMFLKCTEGKSIIDHSFENFAELCKSNGILHGAYHFFDSDVPGLEQAEFFLKTVGPNLGDLPPVVDLETDGIDYEEALAFIEAVKAATGKNPIVYGSASFFEPFCNGRTDLAQYPLWVAQYGVNSPDVPAPWANWTFWQYSDKLAVYGSTQKVDADQFNGNLDALKAFAASSIIAKKLNKEKKDGIESKLS